MIGCLHALRIAVVGLTLVSLPGCAAMSWLNEPSIFETQRQAAAQAAAATCNGSGIELMGLYKNEVFDRAMGGGVVEWLAKIRNTTSVTKIVAFGWLDSYGQPKSGQVQVRGGEIASPRVDLTQARVISPVRNLHLLSCD